MVSRLEKPHKFRILLDFKRGEIDKHLASALLDTTPKAAQRMLTVWSPHLEAIIPMVDVLQSVPDTKEEHVKQKDRLAKFLKVTSRQVNRMLKDAGIDNLATKKVIYREEKHLNFEKRKRKYQQFALSVIAGLDTAENVAEQLGISKKHVYRITHSLCALAEVHYKDLKQLDLGQRRRIVMQIEHKLEHEHEHE